MRKVAEVGNAEEPAGLALYRWLRDEIVTEENTDTIIEVVTDYLPLPGVVTKFVLDAILPGSLLTAVRKVLQRLGQLPSDRYLHELNPFTTEGHNGGGE